MDGLISHLALCGLSACIGLRWSIVLTLARRLLACNPYSGHRCICLITGRFIYTYLGTSEYAKYTTAGAIEDSRGHGVCFTYTTGSSALPDIYAQAWRLQARGRVCIYQAKHECLWYKCYVPHYLCRLIAHQYEVEIRIYYIDHLRKFDYGPAHVSNVIPMFVNKNWWFLWKAWKVLISN